jgi:hypothetical protein
MPVKRRVSKARKRLDAEELEDLFYGPGTALINGCGYLGPHGDGMWQDKPEEVKAAVLDAMRADWGRQSATVLAVWAARDAHALWCAERFHGSPAEPWAQREFGEP